MKISEYGLDYALDYAVHLWVIGVTQKGFKAQSEHPCRLCLAWKRRDSMIGTCWNQDRKPHAATVSEHDSCDRWAPKVITVKKA